MKEFGSSPAPRAESGNMNAAAACPLLYQHFPPPRKSECRQGSHCALPATQSQLPLRPEGGPRSHCPQRPIHVTNCSEKSLASESGDGREPSSSTGHLSSFVTCLLFLECRNLSTIGWAYLRAAGPSRHSSHSFHFACERHGLFRCRLHTARHSLIDLRPRPSSRNLSFP